MPNSFSIFHCDNLKELLVLEENLGVMDQHRLPLSKIFHTLGRKGFLQTVIWEKDVHNQEYEAECRILKRDIRGIDRLHFIAARLSSLADIRKNPKAYGGYCDLRPETRSVLVARITQDAVIRSKRETYAYLCCSMSHSISFSSEDGEGLLSPQIVTFPCCEKDGIVVMCSEAALLALIEYWNYIMPGMFNAGTAIDIRRKAGLPDDSVNNEDMRGLTPPEIEEYFTKENVNFFRLAYKPKEEPIPSDAPITPRYKCYQDIYGFVESRFPVMLCLQTSGSQHAILCLGHTYDRNSWSAMAEVAYFPKETSGEGKYHPNTMWIRHFIIHDDNLGPYFFMPTNVVEESIVVGYVILPDASITIKPTEAADAAFTILFNEGFREIYDILSGGQLLDENQLWLREFLKHLDVVCGDGLVLRPLIITGAEIINRYSQHEFKDIISVLFDDIKEQYFWFVELTWPDIYCHRQLCCGSAIIHPTTGDALFIHIPGVCLIFQDDDIYHSIATREDKPWNSGERNPILY